MITLFADILSLIASWLGVGLLFAIIVAVKGWQIVRQYRRNRNPQ